VNAAFLLVTSAMLVGQAGEKKPAPPPAATAPAVAANCGNGNDCGCDSGHRFRGKLRGLFSRNSNDCCTSAPAPAPTTNNCCDSGRGHGRARSSLFHSRCEEACRPKLWNWAPSSCCEQQRGHRHGAQSGCNDSCDRGGFLDRLRGLFRRGDRCCDTGCNGGATTVPAKSGEKIDAPKVMPKGGEKKPPPEEVRITPQPAPLAPATIQPTPAPAIEIVPVPTPRGESLRRDPF